MGLLGDLKGPLVGFAVSAVLIVAAALYGLADVLPVLARPEPTLAALVGAAAPYIVAIVALGLVNLAFVGWGLYRVASGAVAGDNRLLQNEYARAAAEYAERESEWARRLDLSELTRPDPEQRDRRRLEELKQQYAEGRLSEAEFERRLERLLADSRLSGTEVYGETERQGERERR